MDIRFTMYDYLLLSRDKWPQGLQNYFRDLQALSVYLHFRCNNLELINLCLFSLSVAEGTSQPDAPLILEHQDVIYALQSSSSIRQSSELVSTTVSGLNAGTHFRTISESSLDLESNQRSTVCQVYPLILFMLLIHLFSY
jgi:hypothetical protein